MHGGVKVYRGAASAARTYVEADRSRVDDYYLAEGSGLARRFGASPGEGVQDLGMLDGDGYEQWVAGRDPVTGQARGRLRQDSNAVRFVEITVNGPKTWSLATALVPEVAAAHDAAQDRAAEQIIAWIAEHATTRVGPRSRQVQVPVERIEAVTVRHYTSRAGDPHRHLHLQVNARVFAGPPGQSQWRGLHTVGFRDSIEALNGIGHAAVMCDPGFRGALAAAGFTLDPATGEVAELAPYAGAFSERAAQIGRNIDRYEAQWRAANPGQEPGPAVRRSWDRRAWKDARPDKILPTDGAEMVAHWNQQLHDLGYRDPSPQPGLPMVVGPPRVGQFDRVAAVETVLVRLGARRSAWNAADIRGEAEKAIAAAGLVVDAGVRIELAEDLTAGVLEACVPLLDQSGVPEHVRSLTSRHVLRTETDIVTRLASRAEAPVAPAALSTGRNEGLDDLQAAAVGALAGQAGLVVIEGAAGAGKTTCLAATKAVLSEQGRRMLVVTPTLKAAQVAAREVGSAGSVAWLIHQHGYRWDENGRWTRQDLAEPVPEAVLGGGDLLLVDEAGMLDQDTARALLTVADEMGARVALVGDRHQLPAVGRGGVLDLAARWTPPQAQVNLEVAHRFADPEYAAISLALRTGSRTYTQLGDATDAGSGERSGEPHGEQVDEVWDALWRRGQIRIYASDAERTQALAKLAADAVHTCHTGCRDPGSMLMMADTREATAVLNGAIRDRLLAAGHLDATHTVATNAGERLGVGDRVATRRNDRDLGVTNRGTWTITAIGADRSLTLRGRRTTEVRTVPAGYAREHVELGYATTVYGAQGETSGTGHLMLGEHTSAASAYVAMTRGRDNNVAHMVADGEEDARRQWQEVFGRDRADLGPAAAAEQAAEDIERYGTQQLTRPLDEVLTDLWAAWTRQADLHEQHQRLSCERDALQQIASIHARYTPEAKRLRGNEVEARWRWLEARQRVVDLEATLTSETADLQTRLWGAWRKDLSQARRAAEVVGEGAGRLGRHRRQVRDAGAELTAFAARWRPAVLDLATDPAELADQVRWLHGRRVEDPINAFVARTVADARPDADQIRQTERDAHAAYERAERSRTHVDQILYAELHPYGAAAHTRNVRGRLAAVLDQLAAVRRDLRTAAARVNLLQREPAVRTLPSGEADGERERWADDRVARQQAAAQDAMERRQRQEEVRRIEPPLPSRGAPDHGRSIGR